MKKNIIFFALLSAANIAHAMEEAMDHYFLEPNQMNFYGEDKKKVAKVARSLFQQLCVHANTTKGNREVYFRQVLTKLRLQEIDLKLAQVFITPKDLARVLINIPTGKSYSVINSKKTKLEVAQYETEQDKQENEFLRTFKKTGLKYDHEDDVFYQERYPGADSHKPIVALCDLKISGLQLISNYNFESDPEHHQKIVQEFNNLIAFK